MRRQALSLGSVILLVVTINAVSASGSAVTFEAGSTSPVITSVQNAASNIPGNLPNSAIAPGSIFIIKGSGLGPPDISMAPAAFQSTSLSNTSVAVTVGTATVNALMYYTSAGQIAALLPSNTPTGGASITVTYNGQTSNAAGHAIVANNLGIFTIDSTGRGPGIVTYPDYSLVSAAKAANCGGPNTTCGAANPGDTLILWATGLGPVSGDDAGGAGLGVRMPGIPLTVWLGGVQAPVIYQGRSGCCIGEDQIVFTVPASVPTGCAVPLLVQIGNEISNNTVMAVANGSRNCTPTNPALANAQQVATGGPLTFALIQLARNGNSSGTGFEDDAQFQFSKALTYNPGSQPFFVSYVDDQPLGTCLVYNSLNANNILPVASSAALNAGSSFTVNGPNGSKVLAGNPGLVSATLSDSATYLVPGSYTITGNGGADIGPFTARINLPAQPILASPVNAPDLTVTRSNGLVVTWTGGGSNAFIQLQLASAADNTATNGASVLCNVAAAAGTFTIPSYALLALPPGNFGILNFQQLTVEVPFTATGLDLGLVQTFGAGILTALTVK